MRLWYLSHPEVRIDPAVPAPDWSLSDRGRARLAALVARGWPPGGLRIVTSPETKARETAALLAGGRRPVEVLARSGEVDRSATGYLPAAAHDALARQLFAAPGISAEGWERAIDAQARIVAALQDVLRGQDGGEMLMVGHGAVGSFLWCHVAGHPITPDQDQPASGGCIWCADLREGGWQPGHGWRRIEDMAIS